MDQQLRTSWLALIDDGCSPYGIVHRGRRPADIDSGASRKEEVERAVLNLLSFVETVNCAFREQLYMFLKLTMRSPIYGSAEAADRFESLGRTDVCTRIYETKIKHLIRYYWL